MMSKVFFPICALTWRVNNYVFRREKVKIGEMKVQKSVDFFPASNLLTILIQYYKNFFDRVI